MSSLPPQKTLKNGRYELLRVLGEGSQGSTYEARDGRRDRAVAEKPRPEALLQDWNRFVDRARTGGRSGPDTVAIKAFVVTKAKAWKDVELAEREAKTLASLDHPNLPRYIEHFEEDGVLYLVMEKIDGGSLAQARRGSSLGEADVIRMLEDIGNALRYLHGRAPSIVHRDVKPGNILRRPDGSYALVDFGSVRDRLKPAGGSTVVGTFGYMAPEQFQGRASPQSDVYALGVTAITMLTGCEPEELPHRGLGIDVGKALSRGVDRALVEMLTAMVEPDPERRVGSVDEALAMLQRPSRERRNRRQATGDRRPVNREKKKERRRRRRAKAGSRQRPPLWRVFVGVAVSVFWIVWLRHIGLELPLLPAVLIGVGVLVFSVATSLRRGGARVAIEEEAKVRVATDDAAPEADVDERFESPEERPRAGRR